MSMMGRYVQVSPDRLKQIIDDPSGVEKLFVTEQVSQAIPKMMETLQASLQKRTPQMLAASIAAMDPAKRETVLKGYAAAGVDVDALARGEVSGETLANLMMERARALAAAAGLSSRRRQPAMRKRRARARASRSRRRGTACTTFCAARPCRDRTSRARW